MSQLPQEIKTNGFDPALWVEAVGFCLLGLYAYLWHAVLGGVTVCPRPSLSLLSRGLPAYACLWHTAALLELLQLGRTCLCGNWGRGGLCGNWGALLLCLVVEWCLLAVFLVCSSERCGKRVE